MNLLNGLKKNNTVINTKGSEYYTTTYNYNLDVFTMLSRYNSEQEIIKLFNNALSENEELALANLLYILDIRRGKGERRIFKIIFKNLSLNNPELAKKILPFISILGRYDYILEGLDTPIENDIILLIKQQLASDVTSENPSLLAKWLPSHRTHKVNSILAKKIIKKLNISEKEYRQTLSLLRDKLNIIEKNLTKKQYDNIDFCKVPTKAMLKYTNSYLKNIPNKYSEYKKEVKIGNIKINTEGLFSYEIIRKILWGKPLDSEIYNLMWNKQKDILGCCNTNILVVADTSGSMMSYNGIPYATSLGLALYTAKRNTGIFQNHFITFSDNPRLCEVIGNTIEEQISNVPTIVANTNIDKVFELILNTAKENNLNQEELPSHILIISDMEFDQGVYSQTGTNLTGWRQAFKNAGYQLPIIIFWNVADSINGTPATKFDQDITMISGFSTNILENILTLKNYTPTNTMLEKLSIYLEMLKIDKA